MIKRILVFGIGIMLAAASTSIAQTADPRIGTWKLDLTASKYNPGPPPKSQSLKFEPSGDGFKFTSDAVSAQGQTTHTETVAKLDGKDYPVTRPASSPPGATSRAYKRINARTIEAQDKVKDVLSFKRTEVVSADGKTLTVTQTGPDPIQGRSVNNVLVYDKQ